MPRNWRRRFASGAVAVAFALTAAPHQAAAGDAAEPAARYQQRLDYRRAVHALRQGRSGEYRRRAARLGGYALEPYLRYYEAQGRLSRLRAGKAQALRAELADTPIAERFFRQWLTAQAKQGRWDVYLANYEPSTSPAARCNYLRALYRSGERTAALAQVRDLWVAAESMPKTCDPLFEAWIGAGHLTQETVWARLTLALDAREVGLARYLLRFFDAANAPAGQLYLQVHRRPRTVRNLARFPNTDAGRRALRHGLMRYARQDAAEAQATWQRAKGTFGFSAADASYIDGQLAAAAAEEGRPPAGAPADYAPDVVERIAAALVGEQQLAAAAAWIEALPPDVRAKPRWRYWLGRAWLDEEDPRGGELLAALARERTYYGFLAAADARLPPALNGEAFAFDAAAGEALLQVASVRRMVELYAADDLVNARREWRFALGELSSAQQRTLVALTSDIGWVEQAIFGARDAELLDLLRYRFPMPHLDVYRRYAAETELPLHLLLAVSRQESAFNAAAVSGAGARGLMQLMPPTARLVADRLRVARPAAGDLFDPNVNVRLGAHHFAALMARYGGNRVLAAAAYNAGEGRVERWLKDAEGMPVTVWIERIPFRETRDYAKGIVAYACVYSRLLGVPAPVLGEHERIVRRAAKG